MRRVLPTPRRPDRCERGSALIVAMVFLIILTLLGLSTMTTSRIELRMANNAQFANLAFQAAESGIDLLLGTDALKAKLKTDPAQSFDQNYTLDAQGLADHLSATTVTRYVTSGIAPGYSVDTPALHFQITSTGTAGGGGEAQHIQGFYVIGASAG